MYFVIPYEISKDLSNSVATDAGNLKEQFH